MSKEETELKEVKGLSQNEGSTRWSLSWGTVLLLKTLCRLVDSQRNPLFQTDQERHDPQTWHTESMWDSKRS